MFSSFCLVSSLPDKVETVIHKQITSSSFPFLEKVKVTDVGLKMKEM